jgi:hypothetical protein
MTRIRPKRQRAVGFEALEGRLALSTGMAVAAPHAHHAIVRAAKRSIPASFHGRTSINGSALATTNLTGKIGTDRFTGYGTGTLVNNLFQSGTVYLSNSRGSVQLSLSAIQVKVRKTTRLEFATTVVAASGKYATFVNDTGIINTWHVSPQPNAPASFSGKLNG